MKISMTSISLGKAGAIFAAAIVASNTSAHAQSSSLPGLIVTVPSSPSESETKPEKPKSTPSVTQQTQPKPTKPKVARRPQPDASAGSGSSTSGGIEHKIKLLVNDDPITNYEIDSRARLLAMQSNIGASAKKAFESLVRDPDVNAQLKKIFERTVAENRGKSREEVLAIFEKRKRAFGMELQQRAMATARRGVMPQLRKRAENELIEERLKIQAAQSMNIAYDKAKGEEMFADIAKRNKLTPKQFAAQLRSTGTDPDSMKSKFAADAVWILAVRRKFGRLISISQREVDELVGGQIQNVSQSLGLQKITFDIPKSLDQRETAMIFQTADSLRAQFGGCKTTKLLAGQTRGAKFQDLGSVDSSKISEPTRSMLLAANNNEMLPPTVVGNDIVLYAVCSKSAANQEDEVRKRVYSKLQGDELSVMARRYLADLRRDAHIDRR